MADITQGTVRAAKPLVTEGTQAVAEAGIQVLNSKQIQELAAFVKKKLGFTVPVDRMAQALQSIVSKDETLAGKLNAYRGANPSKQFNAIDSQKIRKALGKEVQDTARINRQPNMMWEDFTNSAEVINRSGFPAISGNRQPQSTISPETGLATTGQPSLRSLVEQEQNRRIGRATSAPMSQLPEKDRLAAESGQRVLEGKVIDMPGEDWKPYPRNSSSPPASASVDATKSKSSLRPGVIAGSTAIMAGSGASGSWEKDEPDVPSVTPEPDEPVNPPAPVGKGGVLDESPQQNVKALTQGTPKAQGGQESLTNSAQDIINKRTEFRSAIGGRTSVDRTELMDAIKSLDTVEEELKKEAAADPSKIPQLKDIAQARRDALDAYKEKANMNEWLSIADRAINAIGQFAAGRAALGTPYTSTYRPGVTDYGAKTEQAMREMQAETGILEKERGESEQAVSAYERQQEKLADRIRRQRESKVRLLEEDVRRQEREIDKADKFSADLMDNWLQTQRIEAQIKRETEKETKAEAQTQAQQDKAQESILQKEIAGLTKILQATNKFSTANTKSLDSSLSTLATALGTDKDSLSTGIANIGEDAVSVRPRQKGFFSDESDKTYLKDAIVPAISQNATKRLEDLKQQLQDIRAKRTGQQPAAAPVAAPTPAAAPTRQQPPATGTIKVRVGNQVGEIPANQLEAFKAKYPDSEVVK